MSLSSSLPLSVPHLTSPSPSDLHHPILSTLCVVCGSENGEYSLDVRPSASHANHGNLNHNHTQSTPFFPILESYVVGNARKANCCSSCAQSLIDQWNHYETNAISIINRVYYLPGLSSHKSPHISMINSSTASPISISTTKSTTGVQRSMATVSPLPCYGIGQQQQPSSLPHPNATPGHPGHSSVPSAHSVMGNPALAATRTSSFASALRHLAKANAFDPIIASSNGQSSVGNHNHVHSSSSSKNMTSSYQSMYQSSLVPPTPPVVTIAPIAAHQIERDRDVRKCSDQVHAHSHASLMFDHRIQQAEQSKEHHIHYSYARRSPPIAQIRPSSCRDVDSGVHTSNHLNNPQSTSLASALSRSGFQPYRYAFEESLRSGSSSCSSSMAASSSLPSHLMPYADALLTYPSSYHPFLSPTSLTSSTSSLSHLTSSNAFNYRHDDPFYLERYGLLRPLQGASSSSALAASNTSVNASNVPLNLARYSEILNSHHERILNEERQRLLNQTMVASGAYMKQSSNSPQPLHVNVMTNNDRHHRGIDSNLHSADLIMPNYSNMLFRKQQQQQQQRDHPSTGSSGTTGSIMSGTPREHYSSTSSISIPNKAPKHEIAPVSPIKPLNLSSNSTDHSNASIHHEHSSLWRPQSDIIRDQYKSNLIITTDESTINNPNENFPTQIDSSRKSQQIMSSKSSMNNNHHGFPSNKHRSLSNGCSSNDNEMNHQVKPQSNVTQFQMNVAHHDHDHDEGLQTRIIENSEKNVHYNSNYSQSFVQQSIDNQQEYAMHSPKNVSNKYEGEERPQKTATMSKLDLKEVKLRLKRARKAVHENESDYESSSDDTESDEASDSDVESNLKYKCVLTNITPLLPENDPQKNNFLEMLNLTTHKKKQHIELNKYLKRRKVLGIEIDKLNVVQSQTSECKLKDENKENSLSLTATSISPETIFSLEKNNQEKSFMMSTLGLTLQTSPEKQRDNELIWEAILKEREMRKKNNKCWVKLINNINKETLQKWLLNLQTNNSIECSNEAQYSFNGLISNMALNNKQNDSNSTYSSLRDREKEREANLKERKVILFNRHFCNSNNNNSKDDNEVNNTNSNGEMTLRTSMTTNGSHHQHSLHSGKDFAQEFHESVLIQTTKQLARQQSQTHLQTQSYPQSLSQPTQSQILSKSQYSKPQQHKHYAEYSSSQPLKWPGIEAIMESYEKHVNEQKSEKDFLQDKSEQLKSKLQDLNREAEYMSRRMADLIQVKNQLDEERERYQLTLDALKKYLRQMR